MNTLKKILYCSADTGIAGAEVLVRVSLLAFYSKVVGLSSDVVGLAIAVAVFWDAVSDPLMGFISDRYTILGQHRRPYFVIGGAVLSVSLYYLFNPPALESINSKVLFLSVWYILMNTGMTILAVPHTALVEKLGQSSHERTILFGWKLFFANIGLMLGSGLPGVFASIYGESNLALIDGYTSSTLAFLVVVVSLVSYYSTKGYDLENLDAKHNSGFNTKTVLSIVKSNHNYKMLLISYFVAMIGLTLNSTAALYYYRYFLELPETSTRLIIFVYMLVFCLSIPVWIVFSRGKNPYTILKRNIFLFGLMISISYPFFPPGIMMFPMVVAVLGGILSGSFVLLETCVAEEASSDATGDRTLYGLYFGLWKMAGKTSRGVSIILAGIVLSGLGYGDAIISSSTGSSGLGLMFGPGVGVFLMVASIILNSQDPKIDM